MLDTNTVIYVIKRRPIESLTMFNLDAGHLCISSITLAELLNGVEKSDRPEHNLRQVEDFVSRLDVLDYGKKRQNTMAISVRILKNKAKPLVLTIYI